MDVALGRANDRSYKPIARYDCLSTSDAAQDELQRLIRLKESGAALDETQLKRLGSLLLEPSCRFYMRGVKGYRRENKLWCSEPFYSGPQGYEMRLIIYANGEGEAQGKNLSVFVQVMDGDSVAPFQGTVNVILINQRSNDNVKGKIEFATRGALPVVPRRAPVCSSGVYDYPGPEMVRARRVGGRRVAPPNPHRRPTEPARPRIEGIREFAKLCRSYDSPYEVGDMCIFEVSVVHVCTI